MAEQNLEYEQTSEFQKFMAALIKEAEEHPEKAISSAEGHRQGMALLRKLTTSTDRNLDFEQTTDFQTFLNSRIKHADEHPNGLVSPEQMHQLGREMIDKFSKE